MAEHISCFRHPVTLRRWYWQILIILGLLFMPVVMGFLGGVFTGLHGEILKLNTADKAALRLNTSVIVVSLGWLWVLWHFCGHRGIARLLTFGPVGKGAAWIVIAIIAGFGLAMLFWGYQYSVLQQVPNIPGYFRILSLKFANLQIYLLFAILVIPIMEECIFRGLMLEYWRQHYGLGIAALLQAAVFVVLHVPDKLILANAVNPFPILMGFIMLLSLALTLLRIKTGSLWPPIMFHMVYNLFVVGF